MVRLADQRVVVLGAGPAGLAAAQLLSERGVRVEVVELNAYVGGLCVTHDYRGFRFDLGGTVGSLRIRSCTDGCSV